MGGGERGEPKGGGCITFHLSISSVSHGLSCLCVDGMMMIESVEWVGFNSSVIL